MMENLQLGDITVKDKGPLGCDFYIGENRIMWINQTGEEDLIKWLSKRPAASSDIDRVSSGRIRPLPKKKAVKKEVAKK